MPAPYLPTGLCFPPGQPGIVMLPPKGMALAAADYTGFTEHQQIEFRNALNEHMLLITSIDGMPVPERFPLLWMRAARQNQMVSGWNAATDIGFKLSLCPPPLWRPIMNALLSRWWLDDRMKRQREHCTAMQQQEQMLQQQQMQQQQMIKQEQMPQQQQMLQMTQMPQTQQMQPMQQPGAYMAAAQPQMQQQQQQGAYMAAAQPQQQQQQMLMQQQVPQQQMPQMQLMQQPGAYMAPAQPQTVSFDSMQSSLIDGFNPPMEQLQMPGGSPQPQYSWTSGVQDIQGGANWSFAGPTDASLPADILPLEDYAVVQSASVSSESNPDAHMPAAAPVDVSTTIDPVLLGIEPEVPTMGPVSTDVELTWEDIDPILLGIEPDVPTMDPVSTGVELAWEDIDPLLLGIEPEVPTMGPVSTDVGLAWDDIDPMLLEIDSFDWSA